jgi:hypothetical protein
MKSLRGKKSKEESQLWHQRVQQVSRQQYFTLFRDNGSQPLVCQIQTEQKSDDLNLLPPKWPHSLGA